MIPDYNKVRKRPLSCDHTCKPYNSLTLNTPCTFFPNTPKQNSADYKAERDSKINRVFSKFKTKKDN